MGGNLVRMMWSTMGKELGTVHSVVQWAWFNPYLWTPRPTSLTLADEMAVAASTFSITRNVRLSLPKSGPPPPPASSSSCLPVLQTKFYKKIQI